MTSKIRNILLLLTVSLVSFCSPADAFHNGGVAVCDGCHVMHNSRGGVPPGTVSSALIPAADPSSICLNCHAGPGSSGFPHVSSPDGSALTPGGDFYWLQKTFTWPGGSSVADNHGHNIVARDYGFTADPYRNAAPWGNFPASDLGCHSCHDPHGRSGSGNLPVSGSGSYGEPVPAGTIHGHYRLLGSTGYRGGTTSPGSGFSNAAPVARQNPISPFGETDASHVDYGASMSEWCTNCHTNIINNEHKGGGSEFKHIVGNNKRLGDYVDTYNRYIKTGDTTGTRETAYLALVPFERGESDAGMLDPTSTVRPDNASNIMCLTCHRAHASAFKFAGRWDFTAELVVNSHPSATDGGVTGNDVLYSYYGRNMATEFGAGQRNLCEKCHTVPKSGYPTF